MKNYTPGPWKACHQNANTGNVSIMAATPKENLQIALATSNDWGYEHSPNRQTTLANAQLIAAAPNLLAALQAILPYAENELASLQECQWRDGGLEDEVAACEHAITQARNAICSASALNAFTGVARLQGSEEIGKEGEETLEMMG